MDVNSLLQTAVDENASDLHLVVGYAPAIRVDGALRPVAGQPVITPENISDLIYSIMSDEQKDIFLTNREIDFAFSFGEVSRIRVNVYYQKGYPSAALRLIPAAIPSIDALGLPRICHEFTQLLQGFILVTGPTGHGKSTTLAAILQEINESRPVHILTIEDPIEYIFPTAKAVVSQREIRHDTYSWNAALRSALREDPDIVLIGEMRDPETIASALTVAETGHLVFATLHTNSASQTVDRIVDVFPEHQQHQVKMQLASTIEAVLSQRLLPAVDQGRVATTEILVGSPAVRAAIREGKTHQLPNIIQTSSEYGMISFDNSLISLVRQGKVSLETAQRFAVDPEEVVRQIKKKQ
jgi:twitching motility protein PilT